MADWDGARYGSVSELQRAMAAESLNLIELEGGERLLDVGCGDGFVMAQIAERLPRGSVLGVDASPRMIEAAQRRDTTASFRLGDATSLDLHDEFDVVTSFDALHWVPDQAGAYRAIAAALRPGGRRPGDVRVRRTASQRRRCRDGSVPGKALGCSLRRVQRTVRPSGA